MGVKTGLAPLLLLLSGATKKFLVSTSEYPATTFEKRSHDCSHANSMWTDYCILGEQ